MPGALVVYATRTGETQQIAEMIAEGLRLSEIDATVVNANKVKAIEDLLGYDIYVFGSATYHGDMMQKMKTMLFLAEKAGLSGKPGGAFGTFGWSGEAPDRIYDTMKHIYKMKMAAQPLRLKSATSENWSETAQEYGQEIAGLLKH